MGGPEWGGVRVGVTNSWGGGSRSGGCGADGVSGGAVEALKEALVRDRECGNHSNGCVGPTATSQWGARGGGWGGPGGSTCGAR